MAPEENLWLWTDSDMLIYLCFSEQLHCCRDIYIYFFKWIIHMEYTLVLMKEMSYIPLFVPSMCSFFSFKMEAIGISAENQNQIF